MSELVKKSEVLDIWYNYWETKQSAREAEELLKDLEAVSYDEQPPLNDNQKIVLKWAKSYLSEAKNIGWFIEELAFLPTTGGKMRYKEVAYVYESLSSQEKLGFLTAVVAWAKEQDVRRNER